MDLASMIIAVVFLVLSGNAGGVEPLCIKGDKCATIKVTCPVDAIYRTFDGSCNNRKHPAWGAIGTPQPRLLPADYDDKKGSPRMHEGKRKLPSPRRVSNMLNGASRKFSRTVSHMHVTFGQLLSHDIVITPRTVNSDGSPPNCNCTSTNKDCFDIMIGKNDVQYIQAKRTCFPFTRSKPAVGLNGCKFPQREQTNFQSSFIDGTFMYGSSVKQSKELRNLATNSGELKTKKNPIAGDPHKLLPTQDMLKGTTVANATICPVTVHRPKGAPCFVAGDIRVNMQVGLTSVQTIWMRYHNKIARELRNLNRHWSSDKIYNEARRIIGAKMQIITYKEYVPPILGPLWMRRLGLNLARTGYWNGYNAKYKPSILNEFSTAAFRFAHSQVAAKLTRPNPYFRRGFHPDIKSKDSFFNSEPLLNKTGGGAGSLMRGFMIDKAEKTDLTYVDALRNQLFTQFGDKFGEDLFAIDIQRGRDHGLPGYNKYRVLCGLSRARSFLDLRREMTLSTIRKLRTVYSNVDAIDLFAGGLAENHVPGGQVGHTFACILGYGFRALRKGDRYWHEHKFSPYPFTPRQLYALRKITFAKLLCDTGDDMRYVTEEPMRIRSGFCACKDLPKFDISAWKDGTRKRKRYESAPERVWTPWFVTDATDEASLDIRATLDGLKLRRPNDISLDDEHVNYRIRRVPADRFLQLQFAFDSGSTAATDFPRELSDQTYWTDWIVPKSNALRIEDYPCTAIAIQAQTVDGDVFAQETGDVFEEYDASRGFVCRDRHQPRFRCQRYKVRALCQRGLHKRISTTNC